MFYYINFSNCSWKGNLETSWNKRCLSGSKNPQKKGPQMYVMSRPNPISVILRMDFPLVRKASVSVFTGRLKLPCFWRNMNSYWVCKNQEILRFLENVWDGIWILKNFINEIESICVYVFLYMFTSLRTKIVADYLDHTIRFASPTK